MKALYIETHIEAPVAQVWNHSQQPDKHVQWDLRFSSIDYIPKASEDAPQLFRYATRLGFGIEVSGWGETVGSKQRPDGSASSALKFGSDHALAIIKEGSGYWKYQPEGNGTRFITGYNYTPRWGKIGAIIDRFVFRPLMSWATAWSFDCFRIWMEEGTKPAVSLTISLVHFLTTLALALVLIWHGVVPKWIAPEGGELAVMLATGVPESIALPLLQALGIAEVLFAFAILFIPAWRKLLLKLAMAGLPTLASVAMLSQPGLILNPFSPLSLTLALVALACVALLTYENRPLASRSIRKSPIT
ncbi:MAG: DoxX-like family protein [Bacteroidia bacterium]